MIIFIYGTDTYRSRAYLKKLVDKFKKERDPDGFNVTVIDCEKKSADEILSHAFASPFLSPKRMVILEKLISKGPEDARDAFKKAVADNTLPEDIIFIIWEDVADSRQKFFATLAEQKYATEFKPLEGKQLADWITREITDAGGTIATDAVNGMATHITNTWDAAHMAHQLVHFAHGRTITAEDVAQFTEEKIEDNIFNLVDAISEQKQQKALQLLENEWRAGTDPFYVFAMLARQFRLIGSLGAARAENKNATEAELAKKVGLHPFVVKKTLRLLSYYSQQQLRNIYDRLATIDEYTKTGKGDMKTLVTAFAAGNIKKSAA